MKYLIIPVLALLTFMGSGCNTVAESTIPDAPIDAQAVAPLWTVVLERYRQLTTTHVPGPEQASWLLDADLLQQILDTALGVDD